MLFTLNPYAFSRCQPVSFCLLSNSLNYAFRLSLAGLYPFGFNGRLFLTFSFFNGFLLLSLGFQYSIFPCLFGSFSSDILLSLDTFFFFNLRFLTGSLPLPSFKVGNSCQFDLFLRNPLGFENSLGLGTFLGFDFIQRLHSGGD